MTEGQHTPSCLDADTAAAYAGHGLVDAERASVEAHIDSCASCRELVSLVASLEHEGDFTGSKRAVGHTANGELARSVGGVLPRGTRIGPYEIDQPLDAGGMGLVYSAHDARLDRRVALKCVRERGGNAEQLLREAKMMAQLSHPNVVPVYDVVDAGGQVYLAMELVVGRSVRQWLESAPRSWQAVVDVFLAAGAGLAAAHAAGIVHGDVKPANVLFGDDGRVRVTDFGLASLINDTGDGVIRGTPAYMAPEQKEGKPCDALADQYAFCVSLSEALYGTLPTQAATLEPSSPPGFAKRSGIPRALRQLLARGLSVDPAARYPSMEALLRELRGTRSSKAAWAAIVLITLVAVTFAYDFGGRQVQSSMCAKAADDLLSPWTPEARSTMRAAFERTQLPFAPSAFEKTVAALDRWQQSFQFATKKACEISWFRRDEPNERLAAQLECLTERMQQARAVVSALREADVTVVLNSQAATDGLGSPETCAQRGSIPSSVAHDSPQWRAFSEKIAKTHALRNSGKFREALPLTTAVVEEARTLKDDARLSAALVALGSNQTSLSDFEHAQANLLEALRLAEIAQDDRSRAQAWVCLVQNEQARGHHQQVLFLYQPAMGACERLGDEWLKSELLLQYGGSLSQLGRITEAQVAFDEAVRLRRKLYGNADRRLAWALSATGNALAMQGDLDGGIPAHRQALEVGIAALSDGHPRVATLHNNLGDDYLYGLQGDLAVTELERSVSIFEAANGEKHRDVAMGLTDLGLAYLEVKDFEKAFHTSDRAERLWAQVNPQHPAHAEALLGRYLALEAQGKPAAEADLEAALPLAANLPPFERARVQLTLGLALAKGQGPAPARAVTLVKAARDGFATSTLPLVQRELARAQAWLATEGAGR